LLSEIPELLPHLLHHAGFGFSSRSLSPIRCGLGFISRSFSVSRRCFCIPRCGLCSRSRSVRLVGKHLRVVCVFLAGIAAACSHGDHERHENCQGKTLPYQSFPHLYPPFSKECLKSWYNCPKFNVSNSKYQEKLCLWGIFFILKKIIKK
jgi:hypothetical protein